MAKGFKGPGMGRPKKKIDWTDVDKLIKIQCTAQEIADFYEMNENTLSVRCKEDFGQTFLEYFKQRKSLGNISLRRAQWKKGVEKLDGPMLRHLGENYLNQTTRVSTEMTGKDGGPIQTNNSELSDAELDERIRLKTEAIKKRESSEESSEQ